MFHKRPVKIVEPFRHVSISKPSIKSIKPPTVSLSDKTLATTLVTNHPPERVVEKIVYVDRPVYIEKIVERVVDKPVYVDRVVDRVVENVVERPTEELQAYEKFFNDIEQKINNIYDEYKDGEKRREQQRQYYQKNREKILTKRTEKRKAQQEQRKAPVSFDPEISKMVQLLEEFKKEVINCEGDKERLNELKKAVKYTLSA